MARRMIHFFEMPAKFEGVGEELERGCTYAFLTALFRSAALEGCPAVSIATGESRVSEVETAHLASSQPDAHHLHRIAVENLFLLIAIRRQPADGRNLL